MKLFFSTSAVCSSSSPKCRMRSPSSAFMSTVGWSASSERAKSVWKATPEAVRSIGWPVSRNRETIIGPGLKPSSVFQSVGSMCLPELFACSEVAS
jgi:hypothetical protein